MSDSKPLLVAPEYLSPSSISTFRQCPLKFKFGKIDGLYEPGSDATVLGNFVHEVLETMYALPPEQRTQDTAKDIARELWASKWLEESSKYVRGEKELNRFRWTAWWCIENIWMLEKPEDVEPWGIETHVKGEIGGVKIHGFIDRLSISGDTAKVSDYKTGKTPKKNYMSDKYFQLIIYTQLLYSVGIDSPKKEIELLYLKDGVRFEKQITQEDIDEVVLTLREVKDGIDSRCESGEFEPKTSILCNWCGFKALCPAWK